MWYVECSNQSILLCRKFRLMRVSGAVPVAAVEATTRVVAYAIVFKRKV